MFYLWTLIAFCAFVCIGAQVVSIYALSQDWWIIYQMVTNVLWGAFFSFLGSVFRKRKIAGIVFYFLSALSFLPVLIVLLIMFVTAAGGVFGG